MTSSQRNTHDGSLYAAVRSMRAVSITALALLLVCWSAVAFGQAAGVSDERVSLPDGPGSMGGVGANVAVNPAMGQMSHTVSVAVPQGWPGLTPSVSMSYSSGSGTGLLGIGWNLPTESIERATLHRLPLYDTSDEFAVNGGELLVLASKAGDSPIYRSRDEGAFSRYQWKDSKDGKGGYWLGESKDGLRYYFGADNSGKLVESARATTPSGGVFRYMLVMVVDRYGHSLRYSYTKSGQYPLIDTIDYNEDKDGKTRNRVRFKYEDRGNDVISDAKPGFELTLDKRLTSVEVLSGPQVIRSFKLTYEKNDSSGGVSRLKQVRQFGLKDAELPVNWTFSYSQSLGGTCKGLCNKPFLVDMGKAAGAGSVAAGTAIFLDINGDALPDLLTSTVEGVHSFQLAVPDTTGQPKFATQNVQSKQTPNSSDLKIGQPEVQVMDVNGDGYVDIVNAKKGAVLCNFGGGDWSASKDCLGKGAGEQVLGLEDDADASEQNPVGVRFFDYNGDKRTDWLKTKSNGSTTVIPSTDKGFGKEIDIDSVSTSATTAVFDAPGSTLQLSDMNGDNLQDAVQTQGGTLQYRLYYGWGKWGPWVEVAIDGFDKTELGKAELMDINGDGLSDIVVIQADKLKFALNRNGAKFDKPVVIDSKVVPGLPAEGPNVLATFADMNGNGSVDVVYVDKITQTVVFLELFPARPNLMVKIENGIGMVQEMTYGTSVAEQARDAKAGAPWKYRLPNAMNVVTATDVYVTLAPSVRDRTEYRYRDGYFDGEDKAFRCFGTVVLAKETDLDKDQQDPGYTVHEYVVGEGKYFDAKVKSLASYAPLKSKTVPLEQISYTYSECPVAGLETAKAKAEVKHICVTRTDIEVSEGDAKATVKMRSESTYDGYGNVTLQVDLGVVGVDGDESYKAKEFIAPGADTGGAWIVNRPKRSVVYGAPATKDKVFRETLSFYDGEFDGVPGKLTKGSVTRVSRRLSEGKFVHLYRVKLNADGQVAETLDSNGSLDNKDGHRASFDYDGTDLVRQTIPLKDDQGSYALYRRYVYDSVWRKPSESVDLTRWVDGKTDGIETSQKFRYDNFGRLKSAVRPPDKDAAPSTEIEYKLADPISQFISRSRSKPAGEFDLVTIRCMDGRGRTIQVIRKIGSGVYQVSGFTLFNAAGKDVRSYEAYVTDKADCAKSEAELPKDLPQTKYYYDALGRIAKTVFADGTETRVKYEPLRSSYYAEDDSKAGHPNEDTPLVSVTDGLGRVVTYERMLTKTESAKTTLGYDDLGRLVTVTDPGGNKRTQKYDAMDRLIEINDPNAGTSKVTYDARGNVLTRADPMNTVAFEYDGMNRPVRQFDTADKAGTLLSLTYDRLKGCPNCTATAGMLVESRYPTQAKGEAPSWGWTRMGYDVRRRPIYRERSLAGHTFVTTSEYDSQDRLLKRVMPDETVQEFSFDGAGRLTALKGVIDATNWTDRGLLGSLTRSNGVKTSYEYDVRNRMTKSLTAKGDDVYLGGSYKLDVDGSILSFVDDAKLGADRLRHGFSVTSDAWKRPLSVTYANDSTESVKRTYDLINNITAITSSDEDKSAAHVGAISTSKDKPNLIDKAGERVYESDKMGRWSKVGDVTLSRNWSGQISKASKLGSPDEVSIYASEGERVIKRVGGSETFYVSSGFQVRDGVSYSYYGANGMRFAVRRSTALAATLYSDLAPAAVSDGVATPAGDKKITVADAWIAQSAENGSLKLAKDVTPSPVEQLLRVAAARLLVKDGDELIHLHLSRRNDVVAATDSDGAVRGERSYYGTGAVRARVGDVGPLGFNTQEKDQVSGLLHYRFRDLDPRIGRWDRADPAFSSLNTGNISRFGEATSGYAFVANEILNKTDPTGLLGKKIKTKMSNMKRGLATKLRNAKQRRATKKKAKRNKKLLKRLTKIKDSKKYKALESGDRLQMLLDDPIVGQTLDNQFTGEYSGENAAFIRVTNGYQKLHAGHKLEKLPLAAQIQASGLISDGGASASGTLGGTVTVNIRSDIQARLDSGTVGDTQWGNALNDARNEIGSLGLNDTVQRLETKLGDNN